MQKFHSIALWAVMLGGCVSCNVEADTRIDLNIPMATAHFTNKDFNDFNPGLVVQVFPDEDKGLFFTGGAYWNSYEKMTYLAGFGHEWELNPYVSGSLAGGLTYGYELNTGNVKFTGYGPCDYQGAHVEDCSLYELEKKPAFLPFLFPSLKIGPKGDKYGALSITVLPAFEDDNTIKLAINFSYSKRVK